MHLQFTKTCPNCISNRDLWRILNFSFRLFLAVCKPATTKKNVFFETCEIFGKKKTKSEILIFEKFQHRNWNISEGRSCAWACTQRWVQRGLCKFKGHHPVYPIFEGTSPFSIFWWGARFSSVDFMPLDMARSLGGKHVFWNGYVKLNCGEGFTCSRLLSQMFWSKICVHISKCKFFGGKYIWQKYYWKKFRHPLERLRAETPACTYDGYLYVCAPPV